MSQSDGVNALRHPFSFSHFISLLTMVLLGRSIAVVLAALVCLSTPSQAFAPPPSKAVRGSPTEVQLFNLFNEGKKALVRSIAGEFDEVAIGARLDSLINDNKVLMLSFTT